MEKTIYEEPQVRVLEVCTGKVYMTSGEKVNKITGYSWDDEE